MRRAFERRRNLIVELAKEIPGLEVNVPQGAFYLFPKCSSFYGKAMEIVRSTTQTIWPCTCSKQGMWLLWEAIRSVLPTVFA